MKPFRLLLVSSLLTVLSACGFQIREDADLPPEMAKTRMVVEAENSVFARRVRLLLSQAGVEFVGAEQATAFLEIPVNSAQTEVLTIGDNARVREYRISHTVRFRLTDAEGADIIPWQTMRQAREISFDEQEILAASREQEYLKQDLAESLSRQLVTRLESRATAVR
jgi:LPS-assembly lipoprotein